MKQERYVEILQVNVDQENYLIQSNTSSDFLVIEV